jgi:peptide/nickel transport system substrate-binding protein
VRLIAEAASGFDYIGWNTKHPIFADARVRQALTMAMNRRAVVDAIRPGEIPGRTTVRPFDWMYDESIALPYDPAAAASLLEQAGWIDRDGNGVREDENGTPLRFTALTVVGTDREDILTVLQSQLREVGAEMLPRPLEANTVVDALRGTTNASGDRIRNFDAVLIGIWVRMPKDDSSILHSRNRNGLLSEGFGNPRVDELLDTLSLVLDRDVARPLWREYQELIAELAPISVISYRRYLVGVHNRLQAVDIQPSGEFVNVSRWWIPPDLR